MCFFNDTEGIRSKKQKQQKQSNKKKKKTICFSVRFDPSVS